MTSIYSEIMIETPKKDNSGVDMSDTSSTYEPDTPVLKTVKPSLCIPLFVLDPIFSEIESSTGASSVKEPDTPVLKTCEPKRSIPLFVLDPIVSEVETSGKSVFYSKDDFWRRLFASPIEKKITKDKFVDKNRIIKCKKLMKNLTCKKRNNVYWS